MQWEEASPVYVMAQSFAHQPTKHLMQSSFPQSLDFWEFEASISSQLTSNAVVWNRYINCRSCSTMIKLFIHTSKGKHQLNQKAVASTNTILLLAEQGFEHATCGGSFAAWEIPHREGRVEECPGVGYRVSPVPRQAPPLLLQSVQVGTHQQPHEIIRKKDSGRRWHWISTEGDRKRNIGNSFLTHLSSVILCSLCIHCKKKDLNCV